MKNFIRRLALTLTAAMLLAAENNGGSPRLVVNWLDWDENGQCYVRDECLSGEDQGAGEMSLALGDEPYVIFFTIGADGKRTPVIPKAGKGVTVAPVDKEAIAPNAKQSKYYVRVALTDWAEGEVASGKSSMRLRPELPDAGFYTAAEASRNGLLRNDQQPCDPSRLTDNAVYFVHTGSDDPNQRQITEVKKNGGGSSGMYDLEKAGDHVWKITLKIPEGGGAWVNLDVTFREADGRTYTEQRGYGFEYPRGPELWHAWVDWKEDAGLFLPEEPGMGCGFNITPGDVVDLVFYTCDYDQDGRPSLTPVSPDKLTASKGITITPAKDESSDKMAAYFVQVTVDEWNLQGAVSCGGYTEAVTSNLPDFGIYSKPELTTDAYLRDWRFSPVDPKETVYIGSYFSEGDDRFLAGLKLAEFENSGQFTLEKYNDDFYKLTRKSLNVSGVGIEFEGAWGWPDGNTEPIRQYVWTEPYMAALVSEKPLTDSADALVLYDSVKDIASNSITLKAGETKTVYLAHMYFREDWGGWRVMCAAPANYSASGNLRLEAVPGGGFPPKYTISSDIAGEYLIGIGGWDYFLYDKDGREVSEEFFQRDIGPEYNFDTGEWYLIQYEEDGAYTPYAYDGKIEFKPSEMNLDWYPVNVTVTGGGSAPETPSAFSDVPAASWYAPAVAFANSSGLMKGNPDGDFNPQGQIKGSEFAQILYNKVGRPAAADGVSFRGVDSQWYAAPILWAAGKGIIADTGDAALVPTENLTRQQVALMLYNYMGKPAGGAELAAFTDAAQVSAWALDAVKGAVGEGVLKGSDNALNPTGAVTRAETAQILMNFFG